MGAGFSASILAAPVGFSQTLRTTQSINSSAWHSLGTLLCTWLCAQCFCALCNSSLDSVRRGCLKKKFLFCFKWRRVLPKVKYLVNIELGLNLGWEIFILPIFLSTQLIAFLDKWMDGWMDELHKGYLCVPWKSSFFLGNSKRHAFYLKEQLPGTFCRHDGNAGWGGGCAALGQLQGHKAGF